MGHGTSPMPCFIKGGSNCWDSFKLSNNFCDYTPHSSHSKLCGPKGWVIFCTCHMICTLDTFEACTQKKTGFLISMNDKWTAVVLIGWQWKFFVANFRNWNVLKFWQVILARNQVLCVNVCLLTTFAWFSLNCVLNWMKGTNSVSPYITYYLRIA